MVIWKKLSNTYVKMVYQAAKKADRIAAEGTAYILADGNEAVIVEINSETDFVAKNEQFVTFVNEVAEHLLKQTSNVEEAFKSNIGQMD